MKIVVLSDTHIPANADQLPKKVYQHLKDCDLIVHAGDITEMSFISELEKIAETKAVWGNMDSLEVKNTLPKKVLFKADGKTIGVTHGSGPVSKVMDSAKQLFKGKKPDVIIFGHSHNPINEIKDGVLFFNPGSSTDRMFAPYRSFGLIEIKDNNIKAEIIKLD